MRSKLSAEGGGSAIEETAILFANGLIEPAEAGLRAAIQADQLGEAAQHGWLMLFELLQQRGDRAGFDSLTIEYVLALRELAAGMDRIQGRA